MRGSVIPRTIARQLTTSAPTSMARAAAAPPLAFASTSAVRLDTTTTRHDFVVQRRRYTTPTRTTFAPSTSKTAASQAQTSTTTAGAASPTPPPPTPPPPTTKRGTPAHRPTTTRTPSSPEEPNVFKDDPSPCVLLTDRAIAHLTKVSAKNAEDVRQNRIALRIAVEPGGCHGYQYKMEIERGEEGQEGVGEEDDFHFQASPASTTPDTPPLPLIIDSISLTLLRGSTIDYVTELIGSQFAIKDNPQAKGAGCGCGVSWEPIV